MKPKETAEHYILSSSPHTHANASVRRMQLRLPRVPHDNPELPPREGVHPRAHRRREGQGRCRGEKVRKRHEAKRHS